MKERNKILLAILIVFIIIQFIQPARNNDGQVSPTDISNTYVIPKNVNTIFKNACYDCHSNNTNYLWYSNVQPIAWLIARDIKKGKEKLNFNEFGSLSSRKQISRLQEIENIIKAGKMPLPSYKLLHKNARITDDDNKTLIEWIEKTIKTIH